jgi:iron complex transport system permease protein
VNRPLLLVLLTILVALLFAGSLTAGKIWAPPAVWFSGDPRWWIIAELRLPRAILGLAIGAALGLTGAVLQGYLRNPLADPGVLGVSSIAALGAVIAIYWKLVDLSPLVLPLLAIAGGLVGLLPLAWLSRRGESTLSLILAGIAVATLAGAGISLALNLAPNPFAAMEITVWLLGSLEDRAFADLWIALPCVAIGMMLLLWDARALDALSLGEDTARALGVDLRQVRLRLMLGIAVGVGGAVAVAGTIGFIGLIVPHLVRPLTDRSPSAVLLPAALAGAALLTFADLGTRLIPTATPLKLGVVTAFLGVPVFVYYLLKERRLW